MKPNYGNWVPTKFLALLYVTTLFCAILLCLAAFRDWLMPITITLSVVLCFSLFFPCYMTAFHHAFSFDGGGMMGKVHEYVVSHLPWDGRGRLLDVGCGAGALTIRCARRFPQSHCTGIDYWGIKWDFLDQQLGMGDTWLYETMRCIDRFTFSIFAFLIIERYIIPGMLGDF